MKKLFCLLLSFIMLLSAAACSNSDEDSDTDKVTKVFSSMEYSIYLSIFYNGEGDNYVSKEYTKDGIFAVLHDSFSDTDRYYVWGYSDETLCCDWQWEFVPGSTDDLPPIGSRVKVSGTLVADEAALDGYWLEDVSIETTGEFEGAIL